MNTLLVLLFTCYIAVTSAQYEEEFTITAGKTVRHPGQGSPAVYSGYGNSQPMARNQYANQQPIAVNPAYYPLVYGANPTLVYVPQTGQVYTGYPVQSGPQFNPNQQQGYYQGYGGDPNYGNYNAQGTYGSYNAPGTYGTYGAPGDANVNPGGGAVGFLSTAFIDSINQAQSTWTAAPNFDDTPETYAYIGDICGVRDAKISKPNLLAPVSYNNKDIPAEFDARNHKPWSACTSIKEIRDQGACGSCWAIAAAESMTDRICIASGGKTMVHISTQDLVECCTTCGYGCDGGYPGAAWNYYKESGIVSGGEFNAPKNERGCKPYEVEPCAHHSGKSNRAKCSKGVKTPSCEKACESGSPYNEDLHFGDISYSIDNKVESIQLEILNYGPVEAAYEVYEDFMSYSTGVYQHVKGNKVGGHAVKLLGWGTENNTDFWWCANSWNTDWGGYGGFFKIKRGTNECNIESDVVAGKPKLGNQPSPPPGFGTVIGVPTPFVTRPRVVYV